MEALKRALLEALLKSGQLTPEMLQELAGEGEGDIKAAGLCETRTSSLTCSRSWRAMPKTANTVSVAMPQAARAWRTSGILRPTRSGTTTIKAGK
jgi:hypothetical protein